MHATFNSKLLELFFKKIIPNQVLDVSLRHILKNGFMIRDQCYILKELYQPHIKISDCFNRIGYECFTNSIHIDDYVSDNIFEQTLLFIENLIQIWDQLQNGLNLKILLGQTDFGFNIKFHIERIGEEWINENELHIFDEAILIITSGS